MNKSSGFNVTYNKLVGYDHCYLCNYGVLKIIEYSIVQITEFKHTIIEYPEALDGHFVTK